jgi:hypothetical protein
MKSDARRFLLLLTALMLGGIPGRHVAAQERAAAPTITVEIWATDPTGQPISGLAAADVEVRQDGVAQEIVGIVPLPDPGLYELRYVPTSGKPGPMSVRSARKQLLIRGPAGAALKPRVIPGRSPVEAELLALAAAPAFSPALPVEVAVYRFGRGTAGSQYLGAVEIAMRDLAGDIGLTRSVGSAGVTTLQIVGRLSRDDGKDERIASYVRAVEGLTAFARLVWTSHYALGEGDYTFEAIVRDVARRKVGTGRVGFRVPSGHSGGLRMSSVVFLQHGSAELASAAVPDDPLFYEGNALLPALKLELPHRERTSARFFVELYPDPLDPTPVSLELEALRDGQSIGRVPIALPPVQKGRIRFVGNLPTSTFQVAPYVVRLIARQGPDSVAEEATLVIGAGAAPIRIR